MKSIKEGQTRQHSTGAILLLAGAVLGLAYFLTPYVDPFLPRLLNWQLPSLNFNISLGSSPQNEVTSEAPTSAEPNATSPIADNVPEQTSTVETAPADAPVRLGQTVALSQDTSQVVLDWAPADVTIQAGDKASIRIDSNDDLDGKVKVKNKGGTVSLESAGSIVLHETPRITITLPTLTRLEHETVGNVLVKNMSGDRLEVENNGVGRVTLNGKYAELVIDQSGTGGVDASNLQARSVSVDSSGVGRVSVYASNSVTVDSSGVGSVTVYGNPQNTNVNQSGVGSVSIN